jgi:hypothetical protein
MKMITLEDTSFPLYIDEHDIEIIIAEEVYRHTYGRYPTYYELYGHPNWQKQLREHLESQKLIRKIGD